MILRQKKTSEIEILSLCGLIIILGKNVYIVTISQTTRLYYCFMTPVSVILEPVNKKNCGKNDIFSSFHLYMFVYVCHVYLHLCMDSCGEQNVCNPQDFELKATVSHSTWCGY